jgi:deoxyribonuclease-4
MSVDGGKHMALTRGNDIECQTIQVFIRNVRGWSSAPLKPKEIKDFLNKREELKKDIWPIISHNSYLINLATSDEEKLLKSYNAMLDELIKADQLGLEYEVMHPGTLNTNDKNETEESALDRISEQLNKLMEAIKNSNIIILLETVAGQGNNLGLTFEQLKFIIDKIKIKRRIGVCFDTCHAFASGYDFTTKKKYDEMWTHFDDTIGLSYLYAFHLNDSEKGLGSRVDRHTHIGQGKIGKEPFSYFLNDERFKDHPGILETPKDKDMKEDMMNLATLRSLIKK